MGPRIANPLQTLKTSPLSSNTAFTSIVSTELPHLKRLSELGGSREEGLANYPQVRLEELKGLESIPHIQQPDEMAVMYVETLSASAEELE